MKPTQAQFDIADKLAVKIVTLVSERISKDGKLYAYDGIEAAREARSLIANAIADETKKPDFLVEENYRLYERVKELQSRIYAQTKSQRHSQEGVAHTQEDGNGSKEKTQGA